MKIHCSDWNAEPPSAGYGRPLCKIPSRYQLPIAQSAGEVTCKLCVRAMERYEERRRQQAPAALPVGVYQTFGMCGAMTGGTHPEMPPGKIVICVACTKPPRHAGPHSWERS